MKWENDNGVTGLTITDDMLCSSVNQPNTGYADIPSQQIDTSTPGAVTTGTFTVTRGPAGVGEFAVGIGSCGPIAVTPLFGRGAATFDLTDNGTVIANLNVVDDVADPNTNNMTNAVVTIKVEVDNNGVPFVTFSYLNGVINLGPYQMVQQINGEAVDYCFQGKVTEGACITCDGIVKTGTSDPRPDVVVGTPDDTGKYCNPVGSEVTMTADFGVADFGNDLDFLYTGQTAIVYGYQVCGTGPNDIGYSTGTMGLNQDGDIIAADGTVLYDGPPLQPGDVIHLEGRNLIDNHPVKWFLNGVEIYSHDAQNPCWAVSYGPGDCVVPYDPNAPRIDCAQSVWVRN